MTATHVLAEIRDCEYDEGYCADGIGIRRCVGCMGDGTRAVLGDTPIRVEKAGDLFGVASKLWREVEGS